MSRVHAFCSTCSCEPTKPSIERTALLLMRDFWGHEDKGNWDIGYVAHRWWKKWVKKHWFYLKDMSRYEVFMLARIEDELS